MHISKRDSFLVLMILIGIISRIIPHSPNLTAIGAIGLFCGASFANRFLAYCAPLIAMICSDAVIGFTSMSVVIYAAMMLYVAFGVMAGDELNPLRLLVASLSGSVSFFLITNFACWWTGYEHTLAGLSACYIAAVPFFHNTLIGDLAYGFALFGCLALAQASAPSLKPSHTISIT